MRYARFLFTVFAAFATPAFASGGEGASTELTARMTTLVIQLGIILFAARLGNMLFERLKMSGVLGELCAGILIGPYFLGGMQLPFSGFENGLFYLSESVRCGSSPISPELYGICSVASIILLFLVGIETDLKMFVRFSIAGSLVGISGVVVSFLFGNLLGIWLLPILLPATITS
jgi:Kef-type K+ transport system membrane component KefB